MKCNKCGFISFDYLAECRKCGSDLTVVRDSLGLCPVRPNVPFLLGPLLKGYDPTQGEHEEPLGNDLLGGSADSGATEIELGDELSFSEASEVRGAEEASRAPEDLLGASSSVSPSPSDPVEAEVSEITLDEEPESEVSISLANEASEPVLSEVNLEDPPEMNLDMDLKLELEDAAEESEKALSFEKALDPGDLREISLERPAVQKKSMEIGDEDLLELILEDDDLVFTLETEEQADGAPRGESAGGQDNRTAKDNIPSIEDINDFVLGLMSESTKKK
ncbi:hypothetical protein [Desulforhabdus sp. TSK]|uniref:hypothetical protein n=1 Tax=Desulforhabdus sp. TSK TaxID=2925014 RepID=UPI001FC856DF|nr:hypothetical protein [Desulforhabdus sp. TSK]GKT08155.1 hypothetical protein DSTSK_14600 [Desulforhabdus sp. TSK]